MKIQCACGCGELLEEYDGHYRKRKYINGHNGRKYKDKTQHKRAWNHSNREARYAYKKKMLKRKYRELLEKFDGRCEMCGLEFDGTNACVFNFHHIDPNQKKFGVNKQQMNRVSIASVFEESKKCILLCSNCHRLLHWRDDESSR